MRMREKELSVCERRIESRLSSGGSANVVVVGRTGWGGCVCCWLEWFEVEMES